MVSSRLWDAQLNKPPKLKPFDKDILSVNGNTIEVNGKTRMTMHVGGTDCTMEVLIGDISNDAILGLDFLKTQGCKVDLLKMSWSIHGKICKLYEH